MAILKLMPPDSTLVHNAVININSISIHLLLVQFSWESFEAEPRRRWRGWKSKCKLRSQTTNWINLTQKAKECPLSGVGVFREASQNVADGNFVFWFGCWLLVGWLLLQLHSPQAGKSHMSFPFVTYERRELARESRLSAVARLSHCLSPVLKPKNCRMYRKFN